MFSVTCNASYKKWRDAPGHAAHRSARRNVHNPGWIAYGLSEEKAIAEAQHPSYIGMLLWAGRLDEILADRVATEALRQLLIGKHKATLENLAAWLDRVRHLNKRTQRGPKPKHGVPIEQDILRLKRAGKTNGQIAKILGTKKTIVAAAYNNITNKIARRQQEDRKKAAALIPPAQLPHQ